MITSKTYQGQAGLNYIQSSDLAFATVIAVKREGLQYDRYISGDPNRRYTHDSATGKVSFPIAFAAGGEKVFVMYKTASGVEPETPPGVCVPVSIEDKVLPDMIVDAPYSEQIILSGSGPFVLSGPAAPDGIGITQSGNTVTVAGTPTTEGVSDIEFTITNCSGGNTDSFDQTVTVIDNTTNFYISNLATTGVKITKVIPKYWVTQTGAFPLHYLNGMTGVHAGFTAFLSVFVTGAEFPFTLSLLKNGTLLQSFLVSGDDQYTFDEQTFINTDQVQIVLN